MISSYLASPPPPPLQISEPSSAGPFKSMNNFCPSNGSRATTETLTHRRGWAFPFQASSAFVKTTPLIGFCHFIFQVESAATSVLMSSLSEFTRLRGRTCILPVALELIVCNYWFFFFCFFSRRIIRSFPIDVFRIDRLLINFRASYYHKCCENPPSVSEHNNGVRTARHLKAEWRMDAELPGVTCSLYHWFHSWKMHCSLLW